MRPFYKLKNNELIKGSFALFILFNFFNFLNYLFQMLMARFLGPGDYGVLASLMALIYIFMMASTAIQLISARYSAEFYTENRLDKVHGLFNKLINKFGKLGILCFLIFVVFSFPLSKILDVNIYLIIITGLVISLGFLTQVIRGIFQGIKRFWTLGIGMLFEGVFKLAIGVPLVLMGWKVYGAILGILLGIFLSFLLLLPFMRDIFKTKKEKVELNNAYTYSFSVFYSLLIIFIIFSLDILVAKILFEPEIAGMYAVASLIGKIIFFGTDPISKAMFPITSGKDNPIQRNKSIADASKILLLLCGCALVIFAVLPRLFVEILFGKQYLPIANIIWITGLAYTFLSFTSLFIHYGLSGSKFKGYYILTIFPLITIVLLYLFHSSLIIFSSVFALSNLLILIYTIFAVRNSH